MRRRCAGLLLVVAAAAPLAGCGDDGPSATATSSQVTTDTTAPMPDLPGRLVFARFDESTHELVSEHTAAADGTDETELDIPEPYGGVARFSHDGNHHAVAIFHDDGRVGTAIIDAEGTVERVLDIPDPTLNLYCSVWSPDDAHLVCEGWDETDESRLGLYQVAAADGGELTRLTSASLGEVAAGDYTPDGTSLLIKHAGYEDFGPLMLLPLDGSGEAVPLADGPFENPGRFSPDGSRIATSDGSRIVVLDLQGEEVSEIAVDRYNLFGPAWSPDGEWLAYSGGTGGPFADIFIARADGSEVRQITDTPDNEIDVDWGADGG